MAAQQFEDMPRERLGMRAALRPVVERDDALEIIGNALDIRHARAILEDWPGWSGALHRYLEQCLAMVDGQEIR